jgi:hypothetical protein
MWDGGLSFIGIIPACSFLMKFGETKVKAREAGEQHALIMQFYCSTPYLIFLRYDLTRLHNASSKRAVFLRRLDRLLAATPQVLNPILIELKLLDKGQKILGVDDKYYVFLCGW